MEKGWGFEGWGPEGWGGPKFRAFLPCLAAKFVLFFPLWGSSSGILVVFEESGPSNVHVWSSRVVVCAPAARSGGAAGFHYNQRAQTRRPEREEENEFCGDRGKNKSEILGVQGKGGKGGAEHDSNRILETPTETVKPSTHATQAHINTQKHTETHKHRHTQTQVEVGLAKVGLAKVG